MGIPFTVLSYFKHSDPAIHAENGSAAVGGNLSIGHLGATITQIMPAQPENKPKHPLEKLPG